MLSRVADACYWMSRYIERAETNARLLNVNMQFLLDYEEQKISSSESWGTVLATLEDQERFFKLYDCVSAENVMEYVAFQKKNPNSIISCICNARENARAVQEQITSEMWEQLNKVYLYLKGAAGIGEFRSSPYGFFRHVVEGSHLFQGITNATMTHGEGWHFIQTGKYIERADSTSRVLDMKYHLLLPSGESIGGNIDITQWMEVLRSCSAMEAYLKIYVGSVTARQVAEFLILHRSFPRSIRFCVDRLDYSLCSLCSETQRTDASEVEGLSKKLRANVDHTEIQAIFTFGLHQYLDQIQLHLLEISSALQKIYCQWLEGSPEPILYTIPHQNTFSITAS